MLKPEKIQWKEVRGDADPKELEQALKNGVQHIEAWLDHLTEAAKGKIVMQAKGIFA